MTRCRDCAMYDLDAVKSARGAVMGNRSARCLWVSTEPWPVSKFIPIGGRGIRGGYMTPNREHDCQTFVPRKDAK